MREISACGGASAGAGTARSRPSMRMRTVEPVAERFDVDVAGAQLDGLFEQTVDGAHDRRAAGEIAQALDVVVGARALRVLRRGFFAAETLAENDRDVFEGGDGEGDLAAKNDFGGAGGGAIAGIGDGEAEGPVGAKERKHRGLA